MTSAISATASSSAARATSADRAPFALCALLGLSGLFSGVTGPLLSNFIPPLVSSIVGEQRTIIGGVMAIDNVLLLLLVPWAGPASDRAVAAGKGRLPIVLVAMLLATIGMALLPLTASLGLVGLIAALVLLHAGVNLQRAPMQALIPDLVPSRYRSLATGSSTFQMCVAAIGFLMLGKILGMTPAFFIAAGTVLAIAVTLAVALRTPRPPNPASHADDVSFGALIEVVKSAANGSVPGLRPVFVAALLLQLTFQSFTTWYALHATERFHVAPSEATVGFIAWALGGVIGALPAGFIGARFGRRRTMLIGFAVMTAALILLDRASTLAQAIPLIALVSATWTLPTVNAYPLFVEPVPADRRGVLASLFLLCMALGGGIGDPLNGALFDRFGSYRALFLLMAAYTALALVAVWRIPRGTGEATAERPSPEHDEPALMPGVG